MRVEADRVTRRFGDVTALREVSFALPAGRRVALVGPNGSGKSTLNRVLMGVLGFEGEVRLDGVPVRRGSTAAAQRIAYVPQTAPQLATPVGELLRTVVRLRGMESSRVEKLAAELGLALPPILGLPFRSLSGGMKQKLLIALALAPQTPLLLLDEPTGSLDARSRERFFSLFEQLDDGTTVMLCSHRLEEVRQLVDEVLFLEEGSLRYQGSADAFLESSATSLLEVRVESEAGRTFLTGRGFYRVGGDWWRCPLRHADKRDRVVELVRALGDELLDLNVRDLERLEVDSPREEESP